MKQTTMRNVAGQPSWRVATPDMEAFVTQLGGHVGPITFDRRGRKLQPYSVAPWAKEPQAKALPAILRVLRGDFFCLPFGGNDAPWRGERHPAHGETANARWRLEALTGATLHASLRTTIRAGRVDKFIGLRAGHPAVYSRHVISGMRGPMNPGHHAMLRFPDEPGSGVLSTSRFLHGQVYPGAFEQPAQGGYQSLEPGATFSGLDRVPLLNGDTTDLTRYPARRGFEDLVMLVGDPDLPFAWNAVVFPRQRYAWFALRDPRVLRSTVLWISNAGRHYAPWSGRHHAVMGIEDVTSYFHEGLASSAARNPLAASGIPTCVQLDPRRPLAIATIMAAVPVPAGFDRVAAISADEKGGGVVLKADAGHHVHVPLDLGWLAGD